MDLVRRDVRPSQIVTRESIDNAIAAVAASGGSTNGVLHLLAIAWEFGIELSIDDFDTIATRTPIVASLDAGRALRGHRPPRRGRRRGHDPRAHEGGPRRTPTRGTWTGAPSARSPTAAEETPGQEVILPIERPLSPTGGLAILRGNLAPEGSVVKLAGHERRLHAGPARVFDREEDAFAAVKSRTHPCPATSS